MKIDEFFESDNVYVIAEIAQNHDGSLGMAHAYIDAVARTGADAIKFQTHIASEESTMHEPFRVRFSYCDNTRYDYWKRMEFTSEQWKGLYNHALEAGLDFLSSPFSVKALEVLENIGVPAWKFGSGEVFNDILLQRAVRTKKPIILSTGLSTFRDIDQQVDMIKTMGNKLILMECTTAYPSTAEQIPIHLIREFIERYKCPVGISDHSATIYPALAAVALGARCVEVHVTMSREMFGPDVNASVTLEQLKEIVEGVKFTQKMLRCKVKKSELDYARMELKNVFSKSIYANRDMASGRIITESDIGVKKPFDLTGVDLKDYSKIIGCCLKEDIKKDEIITWEKLK